MWSCEKGGTRSYKDLRLLWFEVPLHAGVPICVEGDLEDSFLHRLHRLHLIGVVAGHRHAAKSRRLTDKNKQRSHLQAGGEKHLLRNRKLGFFSSPGSRACRAALQRTIGRSSPPRRRRCTSAPSCSWFSTPPPGSWTSCFGPWRLGSECGSAGEASVAGSAQPESAASSERRTEASGRIALTTPEGSRGTDGPGGGAAWLVLQSVHT